MDTPTIPFRLPPARQAQRLEEFNERREIQWFGFKGAFEAPGTAVVTFRDFNEGVLGGGGTAAINGGVISAGFDAAFVLAGLGQYDVDVVVTLELSVQFLSLAKASNTLAFQAEVIRSSKNFCFRRAVLYDRSDERSPHYAAATGMVAPVK